VVICITCWKLKEKVLLCLIKQSTTKVVQGVEVYHFAFLILVVQGVLKKHHAFTALRLTGNGAPLFVGHMRKFPMTQRADNIWNEGKFLPLFTDLSRC
jgi:hypothetical protein